MRKAALGLLAVLTLSLGAYTTEDVARLLYNTGKAYCDNPGPQPHCSRSGESLQ